ncbi:MAG: hypothetical protein JWQ96_2877 [Segetibacter sp.]|nr:hypothetical protein [Segetibacter sp.]
MLKHNYVKIVARIITCTSVRRKNDDQWYIAGNIKTISITSVLPFKRRL